MVWSQCVFLPQEHKRSLSYEPLQGEARSHKLHNPAQITGVFGEAAYQYEPSSEPTYVNRGRDSKKDAGGVVTVQDRKQPNVEESGIGKEEGKEKEDYYADTGKQL